MSNAIDRIFTSKPFISPKGEVVGTTEQVSAHIDWILSQIKGRGFTRFEPDSPLGRAIVNGEDTSSFYSNGSFVTEHYYRGSALESLVNAVTAPVKLLAVGIRYLVSGPL